MNTLHRYLPGSDTAVVSQHTVALVRAAADSPVVRAMKAALQAGCRLPQLLTAVSQLGVDGLPAFAVADTDGDRVHVVQRGDVAVTVVLADGSLISLAEPDASPWLEHTWSHPRSLVLGAPVGVAIHEVSGGVVAASGVEVIALDTDAPSTPSTPALPQAAAIVSAPAPASPPAGARTLVFPSEEAAIPPTALPPPLGAAAPPAHGTTLPDPAPDTAIVDGVPPVAPPAVLDDSDHDGHTVIRPRASKAAGPSPAPGGAHAPGRPMVVSVRCPHGHPNPTTATRCRECDQVISDRTQSSMPRPSLGVLRMSNGATVPLDGPLVFGRLPNVQAPVDGEMPAPVKVDHSELSRSHATVAIVDWLVYVADNGSLNGTRVVVPGQPAERLRTDQRVRITPGTVVDLGGVVTFRYDLA